MATQLSREKAAQAWCKPTTAAAWRTPSPRGNLVKQRPVLGNVTTGEMLDRWNHVDSRPHQAHREVS